MSKSNAATPASFQYINHRFAQKDFYPLLLNRDQFYKILSAYGMLSTACGIARFMKNLLELEGKKLIDSDNEFWISPENDEGIFRIIAEFQYVIEQSGEYLQNIDARLIDIKKARFDLGLFCDQLELIASLILQYRANDSRMTIRSLSLYRSIFQNIHSIVDSLYTELAVLREAANQAAESEATEGVS